MPLLVLWILFMVGLFTISYNDPIFQKRLQDNAAFRTECMTQGGNVERVFTSSKTEEHICVAIRKGDSTVILRKVIP